ncbi:MAG: hypothetical protein R6W82_07725 [bacterium]
MENQEKTRLGSGSRMLATWLGVLGVILLLFLVHMVISLHGEIVDQRSELATKQDLKNLAVNIGPANPAMAALEQECTDCHTSESFTKAHGMTGDVADVVARMADMEGAGIAEEQIPRLEAGLTFMKCAHCHEISRLKELAIMSPKERWDVIMEMVQTPGSTITQEEARRIRDFYGDFWGWHSP